MAILYAIITFFFCTIGKYKIFLVYSIRKTKASAIRLGDKPSFSNVYERNVSFYHEVVLKSSAQGHRRCDFSTVESLYARTLFGMLTHLHFWGCYTLPNG
ncbi:hypothetical protein [Virgibacillus sp. 19R1-5]|nr:hypothetical protein [Virgibacillus sp. 19R1-5]API91188.1 hypothetical protein BKP57_04510 [Virgibacillus sp. 6R]MBS7429181.1 hypothetical protein [Virgibacillus sp. 19R1-5]